MINPLSRQLGFGLHLIIVIKILMASRFCLDTSDNSNRTFVLGDTACQERNYGLTIFLGICWFFLHVMMSLTTVLPRLFINYVRLAAPRKMS